jgi:hypothetical protein
MRDHPSTNAGSAPERSYAGDPLGDTVAEIATALVCLNYPYIPHLVRNLADYARLSAVIAASESI